MTQPIQRDPIYGVKILKYANASNSERVFNKMLDAPAAFAGGAVDAVTYLAPAFAPIAASCGN